MREICALLSQLKNMSAYECQQVAADPPSYIKNFDAEVIKAANNPSISANGNAPQSGQIARQPVQMEAGALHIAGIGRDVQLRQHTGNFRYMLRQRPPTVTALVQSLQFRVADALYHSYDIE
jgi:hypothetical protein